MVTFTRIPYAQAARRARFQDGLVYGGIFALAVLTIMLITVVMLS
jgi:hypothetical protein